MDIGPEVPYFDPDGQLGRMDIDLQVGEAGKNRLTGHTADLRGGQREGFIGAFGLHLEGSGRLQRGLQIRQRRCEDGVHAFGRHPGPGESRNPEHAAHTGAGLLQVDIGRGGFDEDGGLGRPQPEISQRAETMAQIFEQHRFKGAPVEPLEGQLSVFDQQDLLHVGQGPFLPSGIVKRRRRDRVRLRTSDRWDLSGRPDRWWDP